MAKVIFFRLDTASQVSALDTVLLSTLRADVRIYPVMKDHLNLLFILAETAPIHLKHDLFARAFTLYRLNKSLMNYDNWFYVQFPSAIRGYDGFLIKDCDVDEPQNYV